MISLGFLEEYWYASALLLPIGLWVALYMYNKHTRAEMLTMSIAVAPLGLLQPLYLKDYWVAPSIAPWQGFDVESLIYAFCLGGLAAVTYEVFFQKEYSVHNRRTNVYFARDAVAIGLVTFFGLLLFGMESMSATILVLTVSGVILVWKRPDLRTNALLTGFMAAIVTGMGYMIIDALFPQVLRYAFPGHTSISGVPSLELVFAFCAGFFFGPLYEFVLGLSAKRKI